MRTFVLKIHRSQILPFRHGKNNLNSNSNIVFVALFNQLLSSLIDTQNSCSQRQQTRFCSLHMWKNRKLLLIIFLTTKTWQFNKPQSKKFWHLKFEIQTIIKWLEALLTSKFDDLTAKCTNSYSSVLKEGAPMHKLTNFRHQYSKWLLLAV